MIWLHLSLYMCFLFAGHQIIATLEYLIVLFFSIVPQNTGKLFSWLCIILRMAVFLLLISFNIQYWHFLHTCVQFSQETYFIYIYTETFEYLFSNMYNFSFLSIYPFFVWQMLPVFCHCLHRKVSLHGTLPERKWIYFKSVMCYSTLIKIICIKP